MSETKQKDDRETGETTRHADSTHAPVVKTWPLNIISTPTTLLGCWRSCCWADFVQRQSRSAVYAGAHPRPNIGFRLFFPFPLDFSSSLTQTGALALSCFSFFFLLFFVPSPLILFFLYFEGYRVLYSTLLIYKYSSHFLSRRAHAYF